MPILFQIDFFYLWVRISIGCIFVMYIFYVLRALENSQLVDFAVYILLLTSFPVHYAVDRGNIDIILIILFSELLIQLKKNNIKRAAFLLGIISSIKLIFIFFGIIFLFNNNIKNQIINTLKFRSPLSYLFFSTALFHLFGFLYFGNIKQLKEYVLNFLRVRNVGSGSPVGYTAHSGSLDSLFKQLHEIFRVGYFSGDNQYLWGFWNLNKYNFRFSFILVVVIFVMVYQKKNNNLQYSDYLLIFSMLFFVFMPMSYAYRFCLLIPIVFNFLYEDNNFSKSYIFLFGILLSITDILYFKSYLEMITTSTLIISITTSTILMKIIKDKVLI